MSEHTSRALWCRGAGCLSGVGTYLPGTVGQGCRLFKQCQNLPPGHCGAGVQAFSAILESTSRALLGRDAGCLSVIATRLSGVGTYLLGTVGQGSRLFKRCRNLPPGHCGAGVQTSSLDAFRSCYRFFRHEFNIALCT